MKADDAKVWFNLGVLCAQKGQFAEAASAYREAMAVKPDFPEAWYNLGVVSAASITIQRQSTPSARLSASGRTI